MIPVEINKSYEIEIQDLNIAGEGIGKFKGFTIFVEGALPDEKVIAHIVQLKNNYAIGRILKIIKKSEHRTEPICPVYNHCGGCQLQHLSYSEQLKWKRKKILDDLERIGNLYDIEIFDTIGMKNPFHYRNKMQFPVGHSKSGIIVGCYARGSHKIIDTDACIIQKEVIDKILCSVKKAINLFNLTPYDEDSHKGILRHVMCRAGADGELMVVFVTATKKLPNAKNVIKFLRTKHPDITSIQQNIQTYHNNVILGRETKTLFGSSTIKEKIKEIQFSISARSFFQVNTSQAEVLYRIALDFAELTGNEVIIDAYCGIGTIAIFLSKFAHKVYGIEIVNTAIIDAKKNAKENKIKNVEFIAGDVCKIIPQIYSHGVRADVIVVDPPRAGCDKKVLETFTKMNPSRIIYVSCNSSTLARDLTILNDLNYITKKIQPVDMFPFTSHVESVAQIIKKA